MYYIGIDVGGTNLVAGLVDETGRILNKVSTPVAKDMTAEQFGKELARMSRRLCEVGEIPFDKIEAVGVGQSVLKCFSNLGDEGGGMG